MSSGGQLSWSLSLWSQLSPWYARLVVGANFTSLDFNLCFLRLHGTLLVLKVDERSETGVRVPLRKDLDSFYLPKPVGNVNFISC